MSELEWLLLIVGVGAILAMADLIRRKRARQIREARERNPIIQQLPPRKR